MTRIYNSEGYDSGGDNEICQQSGQDKVKVKMQRQNDDSVDSWRLVGLSCSWISNKWRGSWELTDAHSQGGGRGVTRTRYLQEVPKGEWGGISKAWWG